MPLPLLLLLCAALLTPQALAAQTTTPPASAESARTLRAEPLGAALRLDGRLDEAAWAAAPVGDGFTQSWPQPRAPATERTEVRVLFDEHALYVGVRCFDSRPDSIAAQLARRDASGIYSDWVHLLIDSYHDRRTGFRFSVNPLGVKKDVFHFDDGNEDLSWDVVWDVGVARDSAGWSVEYRIPFSQLRFGPVANGQPRVWGLQVQRDLARRDERDSWSPWTRQDAGYVSRAGTLTGLDAVRVPRRLELMPYTSARLTRSPERAGDAGNPFFERTDAGASVGADLKAGLPLGLTLTATLNPDFGQVEADPAEVNLSAFESFFSERRPFFVEGSDVFRFGDTRSFNNYNFEQYFYSRRIGRAPQRGLGDGEGIAFVDVPQQSTILGAAKVSGKMSGWTVGLMNALTAEEQARVATSDGRRLTTPVEPLSNYFVGRLRRDLRDGASVVGAMLTSARRDLGDSVFSGVLREHAEFGGVDFYHGWAQRRWSLSGYLAGSRVVGSPAVIAATQRASARYYQRPDQDHLTLDSTRTALAGHMAELALAHGGPLDFSLSYKQASPGFELNDLGFQGRVDYRAASWLLFRNVDREGPRFRSQNYGVFGNLAWNFGGQRIFHGYGAQWYAQLKNFWELSLGGRANLAALSDRLTRGGPLARQPASWSVDAEVESDARKPVAAELSGTYQRDEAGGDVAAAGLELSVRPSTSLRLSLGPELEARHVTAQYVSQLADPLATPTFGRRYLFADLHQTTFAVETRLDWTFTPTLSLQLFAQPFVSAGDYRRYKEFLQPGGYRFAVYGRDAGTLAPETQADGCTRAGACFRVDPDGPEGPAASFVLRDRDFNFRSLRGNAVLRWEYRPGSALFFVWQQERSGQEHFGGFHFRRDAGAVFREPATNVFLVKATYWLGR